MIWSHKKHASWRSLLCNAGTEAGADVCHASQRASHSHWTEELQMYQHGTCCLGALAAGLHSLGLLFMIFESLAALLLLSYLKLGTILDYFWSSKLFVHNQVVIWSWKWYRIETCLLHLSECNLQLLFSFFSFCALHSRVAYWLIFLS